MSSGKHINIFSDRKVAKNYDRFYETPNGKALDAIEKKLIHDHIRTIPPGEMLELGCGTGHWTEYFSCQGFKVTATDNSEAMLRIAETKKIKNAVFLKADAAELPFPDHSFPVITSVTMLEFVENEKMVLNEIHRVLKPGGHLILGCLNRLSEPGKAKNNDEVFKHARFFTSSEVSRLLSMFGTPSMSFGVYLSSEFELLDGKNKQNTVEPAFIVASVQKI
jgi:ubiquinone/menaquinone biosynthesis C-methylase UbiE